jgi:DNA polymerase I-like protein with 3'-5' exonuclease and polymerase domains
MSETAVQTDLAGARFHYLDTVEDAWELMRWLSTQAEVAIDTETTGLSPERDRVRLFQIGSAYEGWTIPFERWGGVVEDIVRRFTGYYRCHHAKFEYSMLKAEGIQLPKERMRCSLLMSHVLESTGSLALKTLASRLVDKSAGIGQRALQEAMARSGWTWGTIPLDFPGYWTYAALDTVLTYRLTDVQYPRVLAEAPNAYELELATTWVTERMERRGALVDREYVTRHAEKLGKYVDDTAAWCKKHYGVYPGSDMEVIRRLQRDGVEFSKLTRNGRISLDKEVLATIDHPLAQAVLNRRKAAKLVSTYLEPYLAHSLHDGLLHPHINVIGGRAKNPFEAGGEAGVRTGRMSMDEPNLQNVPRHTAATTLIRDAIIAREGNVLVMCDFDQIEMRIFAHLMNVAVNDPSMRDTFLQPGDFFVNAAREVTQDPTLTKDDPRRQMTKNACVPLDTQILTRRGWLKHDEVRVGDETLGLDPADRRTKWTQITAVHHYEDAEVVRLGNRQRSFETTREHRWISDHEKTHQLKFVTTDEQPQQPYRVVLAAEATIGGELHITSKEAAIIGWILGDGGIYRGRGTGPSQAGGQKRACGLTIGQKKLRYIREIDALLADVPHRRAERNGGVCWKLEPNLSRDLLRRAEIWDKWVFDPWQLALRLGPEQRRAMATALHHAEGNEGDTHISMSQLSESPVSELMCALGYLLGYFARGYERPLPANYTGWTRQLSTAWHYQKPYMTGQKTTITSIGRQPVWCVTTTLGTWTMRQGRTPVLTGNSYAKIYGAGLEKFALTARVPIEQARPFLERYDAIYPGARGVQDMIGRTAEMRRNQEGDAYVRSPLTNRKHVADQRRMYALVNYLIQGTAAEVLKMKGVELDNAGLGDYLVLPVHDEYIADVPEAVVRETYGTLMEIMNDDGMFTVPITASVSTGKRWGSKEDYVIPDIAA